MHCFGGCSVDAVTSALGLTISDLYPPRENTPGSGSGPLRRTWITADVIRAAAFEASLAAIVASDLAAGRDVSEADRDRLVVAASRLTAMSEAASASQ